MGRLYVPTWSLAISVCGILLLWSGATAQSDYYRYSDDEGSLRCPGIETSGDGYCDATLNNDLCEFDGGDCCACTCIDGPEHTCGAGGYNCVAVNCQNYPRNTNSTSTIASSSRSITGAQLVTGIVLSVYGYIIFGGVIGAFLWYIRRLCLGKVSTGPAKVNQSASKLPKVVNLAGLPTIGGEAGGKRPVAGGGEVKGEEPAGEDVETGFSRPAKARPSVRKPLKARAMAGLQTTGGADEKRPVAGGGEVKKEGPDETDIEAGSREGGEKRSAEAGIVSPIHANAAGVEGDKGAIVAGVQTGLAPGEGGADSEDAEADGGAVERKMPEKEVGVDARSIEEIGDEEGVDTEATVAVNSRIVEKAAGVKGEVKEGGAEQSAGEHIDEEENEGKVLVTRDGAREGFDEIGGESAEVGGEFEEISSCSVTFSAQESSSGSAEIGDADKSRHDDQVANTV